MKPPEFIPGMKEDESWWLIRMGCGTVLVFIFIFVVVSIE